MTSASDPVSSFVHRFVPASQPGRPPLLLLHGTGGNEEDLIPLGARLSPGAALLAPRGRVIENGMPRFFRRVAEGVFDREDLDARTAELARFLAGARHQYAIEKPIALGFSNGANIAWSLLLAEPQALAGAILMRPMLPFDPGPAPDLGGIPVLILSGASDPIVPALQRDNLATLLRSAGAEVEYEVLPASHNLTQQDLALASAWLVRR